MRKNNIFGGIVLILLAVFIMGSGMGLIPNLPWFKIAVTVFLAAVAIKGLLKLEFFSVIMPLCVLGWIHEDILGIEDLAPFPLFLAGLLVAIGLNMIFKRHKRIEVRYQDGNEEWRQGTMDDIRTENWQDGRHVSLENNFNSVSKYVNSDIFSSASFENNFGTANIYFTNAIMANAHATVIVENNFGEMNIYFPRTWRMRANQEAVFGNVNVFGTPSQDPDAPLVDMTIESNFGNVKIYFE